jgi:hypothetical protein
MGIINKITTKNKVSLEQVKERLSNLPKHITPKFDTYIGWKSKMTFIDLEYGEWSTLPYVVLNGHQHPKRGNKEAIERKRIKYGKSLTGKPTYSKDSKNYVDLMGKVFGDLTVVEMKLNPVRWICKCSCGELRKVRTVLLTNGTHTSCEKCSRKHQCDDIKAKTIEQRSLSLGKSFGNWTLLSLKPKDKVECRCTCGKIKLVNYFTIIKGLSTNCGCIASLNTSKRCIRSLVGNQYGYLRVIKRDERYIKRLRWMCECKCGKLLTVRSNHLKNCNQNSCGCVTKVNEGRCRDIFESLLNKKFPTVRPDWLKNTKTGYNLELDGYCEELNLAFEYDGEQHFKEIDNNFRSSEPLHKVQERDSLKDELCKIKGIILIRIPYTEKKRLKSFIQNKLKELNILTKF